LTITWPSLGHSQLLRLVFVAVMLLPKAEVQYVLLKCRSTIARQICSVRRRLFRQRPAALNETI